MILCLLLLAIIMCGVRFLARKPRRASPPVFPGRLPVIGHAYRLFGSIADFSETIKECNQFSNENGGIMECNLGPQIVYLQYHIISVLTDPDVSLTLANTCFDRPYLYDFGKKIVGNGIFGSKGNAWKALRKLLNKFFGLQVLNSLVEVINEHSRELVSKLSPEVGNDAVDIEPYMIDSVLKIVNHTTLGLSLNKDSSINDLYADSLKNLFQILVQRFRTPWLHIDFIFNMTSLKRKQDECIKIINDISTSQIQKREVLTTHDIDNTPDKFKSHLEQYLTFKEKGWFTDDDILDNLKSIVVASIDTTSKSIMYILLLLGSYLDVQVRVYQELKDKLGDRDVTKHDLPNLVYLEVVIKECLRLYPPVPLIARHLDRNIMLKDYTLQSGSIAVVAIYGMNRSPTWGRDADQFRPERWLEPDGIPSNAYATFSFGKRNCIGQQYAVILLKTYIAKILRRYRVHSDISKLELQFGVVLKPSSGHEISLELRT